MIERDTLATGKTNILIAGLFLAGFSLFVIFSELGALHQARSEIRDHARIVSDALWHFTPRRGSEYLTLACKSHDYKKAVIRQPKGETFLAIDGHRLEGWDKILHDLGLIPEVPLSTPITHTGQSIGTLEVVWHCKTIYHQAYVLFALVLIYLVIHLYLRLLYAKQRLENQVQKRTLELSQANLSLQQEIAKQQQAVKEKQRSEERFQNLADLLPIPLWEADLAGNFTYLNRACYETFKLTPEELEKGFPLISLVVPEDRERGLQNLRRIADGERSPGNEYWCQDREGKRFPVLIYSAAIVTEGKSVGVRGITIDLSERFAAEKKIREHEEKLARSRKMESLGLLAGGVAHDLNNILSGIVTYPELLLLDLPPESRLRRPLETIQNAGQKAAAIVQDLLTIARGVATTKEPLNLNEIIADYLRSPDYRALSTAHPEIEIHTELDPELPNIEASAIHLHKVVMNLVGNAIEAITGNGRVTITTTNLYLDSPLRGYDEIKPGDYVVLSVSDTGSGIPSENLERIFEPFYTRKTMGRSGTGLGLAIVWNVVQDHGAYINVTSDSHGSRFKLYFPVTTQKSRETKKIDIINEFRGRGETILVVDDLESQREISRHLLERLGYQVETAASGEAAIAHLRENRVELVLLDMIMEAGLNGRETYERIIEFRPGQKCIIVSGFARTDEVEQAQSAGAGSFLKKPVTLESLGRAVREALDS